MTSSLGSTWLVLVKVNNRYYWFIFPLRVFHVNIGVIAMWFKLVLFYFISLEIARNILIWYQSGLNWTLQQEWFDLG